MAAGLAETRGHWRNCWQRVWLGLGQRGPKDAKYFGQLRRIMTMKKLKTSSQLCNEGTTASKQTRTPQEAFEIADRKVARLHAGLFRRLAEHDRQKDARNK